MVQDLTLARRFIMQKLAVGMLNIIDQLHTKVCLWFSFYLHLSPCFSNFGTSLQVGFLIETLQT